MCAPGLKLEEDIKKKFVHVLLILSRYIEWF